jgi:hypothetical protein
MSLPVVFAIAAAGSKIYSGVQQQKMYNMQAEQARLQGQREALRGRVGAINANNQALSVLQNQRRFYAAVNARAAAGGVQAFEGSPAEIMFQQGILSGREYDIARENAVQSLNAGLEAQLAGEVQGKLYRQAGKDALMGSILEAGLSAYQGYKFGQELQTPAGPPADIEWKNPLPSSLSTTRPATLARPGESVAFNR